MNDNSLPLDTASDSSGSVANSFNFTSLTNFTEQFGEFYRYTVLRSTSALEHIVWFTLLYTALCLIAYRVIFQKWAKRYRHHVQFPQCKRALIVTAHPDDECMFFGPTIISLTKRADCHVYLLCLSNGNFGQIGQRRQQELWDACNLLNIPADNITLFNATLLPDDPQVTWKPQLIAKQILKQVHTLDIDTIITFDRDGVSQHANHCAIFYASISIYVASLLQDGCRLFTLDSVNLCRKYTSILDLLVSMALSKYWCILSWTDFRRVQRAMWAHQSQMVWFRRLYINFSRYMVINTLREMQLSDAELEMQLQTLHNG